jgi:hypothetical protein
VTPPLASHWAAAVARAVLLATIVAAGTLGCGEPDDDRIPGPRLLDEFALERVAEVSVDGDGFDTTRLEVTAGQAIDLVNDDDGPVRIRGRVDDDLRYDTGDLQVGDRTTLGFRSPGVVVVFTVVGSDDDDRFVVTVTG